MLRDIAISNLSRRRLNNLAVDLGIFDAANYERRELEDKFIRSRLFSNETMLHFLTLNELRNVALKHDIETAGVSKQKIISRLLSRRKSAGLKISKKESNSTDERTPEKVSDAKQDSGQSATEHNFDIKTVPHGLLNCTHIWLYQTSDRWILSSRAGTAITQAHSRQTCEAWLSAFNKYRGFENKAPKFGPPPGPKKRKARKSRKLGSAPIPAGDFGYKTGKSICPICAGDGGATGHCYKCGGTGWA